MRVYSFQPVWIYEELKRSGYWRPHGTKQRLQAQLETEAEVCPFIVSYDWLGQFMLKTGIKALRPVNDHMDMIWVWRDCPELHPDGSSSFYAEPHVLIELEVSQDRVLLSDFDIWHHPLNLWPVASYDAVNKFLDENPWELRSSSTGIMTLQQTWPNVVNLPFCASIAGEGDDTYVQSVQGTLFDIELKDVVSATYLVAPIVEKDELHD